LAFPSRQRGGSRLARVVAVELGLTCVRAAEVETAGDAARLVRRGSAPLPADAWADPAASRDALAEAIRGALSAAGITPHRVVAALPRSVVTLKYARLPHATPEQVQGMVQFEAQQYIPFPMDEVVLDHLIVSEEGDELTTVMVVAARQSLVEQVLAAFEKAGVEVEQLTVSSLGLVGHAGGASQPVALLDFEPGEMELAVVSEGRLLFSRAARLPDSPAEHSLASEVARSFAAFQNEHRSLSVSRLLLAGSVGALSDAERALPGLVDVPVSRVDGFLDPGDAEALAYAVAAGLAADAARGESAGINLVPASRLERKAAVRRRTHGALAAAAVLAVLAFAGVSFSNTLAAQQREAAAARRENRRLEGARKALAKVKAEHDRAAKTFATVAGGLGRDLYIVDLIKAVSDGIPKNSSLHLTQLTIERGGQVAIHGTARTEAAATDLVLALQGSGAFRDVRLGYMGDAQTATLPTAGGAPAKKAEPVFTFIINCKPRGGSGPEAEERPSARRRAPVGDEA